jgi:23S rRNA (cytidine1920-2'-O)/16S rRNA (cytidine1409-2'-O)-methyltransferase
MTGWLQADGQLVALIKPQFEAGKKEAARGRGVIRNLSVHKRVLEEVVQAVKEKGLNVQSLMRSPVLGPKGNVEFLLWANRSGESHHPAQLIDQAMGGEDASS